MPLDFYTRADLSPATLDRKARTVEAVLSTGAPVQRYGFDGPFTEQLDVRATAVDLSRMPVSILDGHRQDGVSSILGTVLSVRFEDDKIIGTMRISARHDALLDDIAAGDIRSVSIGYTIESYEERPGQNGQKVRTATRWTLVEASFVPVPADPLATIRSQTMNTPTTAHQTVTTPPQVVVQTRAEIDAEIRALYASQALPADQADMLVAIGATADQARNAAQLAVTQRTATRPPQVTAVQHLDSPEQTVERMGEALYARINPRHQLSDAARQFAPMTMLDMARHMLTRSGQVITGLSPSDTFTRSGGLHSTSDFPAIFANTANRVLRASYEAAPVTLKKVGKQTTARDFRAKTSIGRGEMPILEKVNEHGEFHAGTTQEAKETYALATHGKIFGITRQALVNDDLGAFSDMAGLMGRSAVDTEAQLLVNLLESNTGLGPTMDDTVKLFDAAHGNKAASGAVISAASLTAARLALRTQKGLSGRPINVPPKYLLVHPAQETLAESFLASINPSNTSEVNPFSGKLELLVEARLSSTTRWYVIADPASIDGLEYAYLQGEEGPQVETKAGFEVDGVQFKVRLDFGAGFLDWRPWYMNPGA